jgi:hypothetical protein
MIGSGGDAISNDMSSLAATGAAAALVVLLGASALAARRLRSPGRSGLAWFAALGSVALVIAVTLLRDGWPTGIELGRLGEWSRNGWDRLSTDPLGSQVALNVALFVPAGAAWTWLLDRPWRVLAGLVAGSFAVELVQAVLGIGAADVADVAANTVGAAVGVGVAVLIRHASRRPAGTRRLVGWPVITAAGAIVLAAGAGLMRRREPSAFGGGRAARTVRHHDQDRGRRHADALDRTRRRRAVLGDLGARGQNAYDARCHRAALPGDILRTPPLRVRDLDSRHCCVQEGIRRTL